jgi:hypothetical protein
MIVHLVLFTPRATLTDEEHETFRAALDRALSGIPSIRRMQVGRRLRLGTQYDALAPLDFSYVGVLEFDTREALLAYLVHPAHQDLGRLFYETSAHALACDFETVDSDAAAALARWRHE